MIKIIKPKIIITAIDNSFKFSEIAKILYKIDDINQCKLFLNKAKLVTKSKDREFWTVRELINIAIFENSIGINEESNAIPINNSSFQFNNCKRK